jgi:hypothetical protein
MGTQSWHPGRGGIGVRFQPKSEPVRSRLSDELSPERRAGPGGGCLAPNSKQPSGIVISQANSRAPVDWGGHPTE